MNPPCPQCSYRHKPSTDCLKAARTRKQNEVNKEYHARKRALFVEAVNRKKVLALHQGVCHVCGHGVDSGQKGQLGWHVDHVIPLNLGGPHCYANVAVAHQKCDDGKQALSAGSPNPTIDRAARAAFRAFHGWEFSTVGAA